MGKTYYVERRIYGKQTIMVRDATSKADAIRQVEAAHIEFFENDDEAPVIGVDWGVDAYGAPSQWTIWTDQDETSGSQAKE